MKKLQFYIYILSSTFILSCDVKGSVPDSNTYFNTVSFVTIADTYLSESPQTITSYIASNSAGNIHEYYSEGPYWWPNPKDPSGPYIQKDGERNPDRYKAHRVALSQFHNKVVSLTAAYLLTDNNKYSQKAVEHLEAWFVNDKTKMSPHLEYAQAIKGLVNGRGIGIIDAVGLIDICNIIKILDTKGQLSSHTKSSVISWFEEFSIWLITSSHGQDEANHGNNHSTWWGAQIAAYSLLTDNQEHLAIAKQTFKKQLDFQMVPDGKLPHELARTRPWHYTNYTLRAWAIYALLLSNNTENFWSYTGKNGSIKKAFDFVKSFRENPQSWPYCTYLEKSIRIKSQDYLLLVSAGLSDSSYKSDWKSNLPVEGCTSGKLFLFTKLYNL